MKIRELGKSQIQVGPLAFGGNVLGWTISKEIAFPILDRFLDEGCNLIDTADVYSAWAAGNQGGESEKLLGEWMHARGNRQKVVLATKVGKPMGEHKQGLSKKYILQAVEASLSRLQTDYIDLYQSHDDDRTTPLEETLEAFNQLIGEGKVRAIGASNYTASRLAEALRASTAHGLASYQVLQPHYNLMDRAIFEKELAPFCAREGISVIPYYSLASGFLSGKYRSQADLGKSPRGQGVKKYLTPRGLLVLDALDQLSRKYRCTPAAVSISWLLNQATVTAPIASATSIPQLEELIRGARLSLEPADVLLLNEVSEEPIMKL